MTTKVEKEKTWQEILSAPFDPSIVKWRPGRGDRAYAYVDARNVMDRLDAAFGPERWATEYRLMGGNAVECTIWVFFPPGEPIRKSNVGYSNDPAKDTEASEPLKAAYSDAFKRAAVDWGIGRELYDMPIFNIPVVDGRLAFVPVWVDGKGWVLPASTSNEPINAITKKKIQNAMTAHGFDINKAKLAVKTSAGVESLNLLTMAQADKLLADLATPAFVAAVKAFVEEAA